MELSKETLDKMHSKVLNGKLKLYQYDRFGFNVQNLIILAHGGAHNQQGLICAIRRAIGTYSFISPIWTTLFFYVPHGTVTVGSLLLFMDGTYRPFEAFLPGETVINYDLCHWSDNKSAGSDEYIRFCLYQSRCGTGSSFTQHPFRIFDIVTTEPSEPWGVSLKEVLDILLLTGQVYPRVHCTFCRYEYRSKKRFFEPTYDYMRRYSDTQPHKAVKPSH